LFCHESFSSFLSFSLSNACKQRIFIMRFEKSFSAACSADFLCLHIADFYSRSISGRLFCFFVIKKRLLQA